MTESDPLNLYGTLSDSEVMEYIEEPYLQLGKELLEHSFKIARSKGCSLMNIGIVEENTRLRKWYEDNGAVHVGTKKFDFFPFTCGYMKKEL